MLGEKVVNPRQRQRQENNPPGLRCSLLGAGSPVWLLVLIFCLAGSPLLVAQGLFSKFAELTEAPEDSETLTPSLFPEYSVAFTLKHDYQPYGPLVYRQYEYTEGDLSRFTFLPPLFSVERNEDLETLEMDFLYPFFGVDRYGLEYRVHIFQIFYWAGGTNVEDQMTRRFSLFPFYMQQRSEIPEENYRAFLPIYGELQHRMWRDEVEFILMPLYVKTRKKDVTTWNCPYPFFHIRRGDHNLNGWQLWPLMGQEKKEVGTVTDIWGDELLSPGHSKEFYLWPIGLHQKTGIGTENPTEFYGILPFYAQTRSPNRDHSVILWPFFNWADDREQKYREWGMPYPFIVFARGEGKTTDRIFPLFGSSYNDTQRRDFILWPTWKKTVYDGDQIYAERQRLFYYLYSDVQEKYEDRSEEYRRTDLWPLFTARLDANDNYRMSCLSPFEPFFPGNKSIQRNWTPLASLWSLEENSKKEEFKESLFWNLYRHEENPRQKRWSALFGLIERVKDEEYGNYWRFFYSQDKRRVQEARKRQMKRQGSPDSEPPLSPIAQEDPQPNSKDR